MIFEGSDQEILRGGVNAVVRRGALLHRPAGPEPAEVVCHSDAAPYNTVFRSGHPVALIDFDTAHPGPRVWDVAYAVYRFVPLGGPANHDRRGTVAEGHADLYDADAAYAREHAADWAAALR
ncbi:phosphotransferase [Hamadaea sp.]|uniref:phosphotransferase n=1 Tax=Hamadaea sp. TaxID=2024425 RepID=UPI0025B868E9|nr:phosphotransferase [Hamadaea sp.]